MGLLCTCRRYPGVGNIFSRAPVKSWLPDPSPCLLLSPARPILRVGNIHRAPAWPTLGGRWSVGRMFEDRLGCRERLVRAAWRFPLGAEEKFIL